MTNDWAIWEDPNFYWIEKRPLAAPSPSKVYESTYEYDYYHNYHKKKAGLNTISPIDENPKPKPNLTGILEHK